MNSKPFADLNLIDDFLFDVATVDLETCKDIIELSLNIRIREIRWKEGQKVVHNVPGCRGIRLDFYVIDETGHLYDVEMQARNTGNIPKRTRFYKALLDAPLLKSGEAGFDRLPTACIIFICGFDLFGYGKYRYTFDNRCREVPELTLEDELHTVFLNTEGNNEDEVEPALVEFLKFVRDSSQATAASCADSRVRRLGGKIARLKGRAELEAEYMKMEDRDRQIYRDGYEDGERNGERKGEERKLHVQVEKKLTKGKNAEEIAEALEEELSVIQGIISELKDEKA